MKNTLSLILTALFGLGIAQNSIDANIPDKLAAYSTHTIEITIKKGQVSSFSKYQLDVPANVSVKEGISKDGNFSFENQRAKLVWVECPKTDEFTVTMILSVGNATGQASFDHRFYYIDGDTKKEISDGPMHVDFTPGTPSKTEVKTEPVKTNTVASTPAATQPTAVTKTEEPKKTNITIPVSTPTTAVVSNTTPSTTQPNSSNTTPSSVDVKEYKIQIGSFASKPSLAKYSNIGKVTVIEENGGYKVLAGSYPTKEEAVKRMEELKNQGFPGFVVCFINGVKAK
ncbi:MAG: SPOR domain-containing protein [Sphingobacteriaceae bacterium]